MLGREECGCSASEAGKTKFNSEVTDICRLKYFLENTGKSIILQLNVLYDSQFGNSVYRS